MQTRITDFVDKKEQLLDRADLADLAAKDLGRQLDDSEIGVANDSKHRSTK
jgi:hypothetical protein